MARFLPDLLIEARTEIIETDDADTRVPLSLANEEFIRISNEIPAGIKSWSFKKYTRLGIAAVILNPATGVPVTNRTMSEEFVPIYPIRVGFEVTEDDIESAEALGQDIVRENLQDNREAIDQKLDIIAYSGEPGTNLRGLANYPNVTRIAFPADGTGSSSAWDDKTPAQILRDMNLVSSQVLEQTAMSKNINRILVPTTALLKLSTEPYTSNGDSILTVYKRNQASMSGNMGVSDIVGHPVLENLGTAGVGLIIGYNTGSNNNKLHIPQGGDFRDMPPSLNGTTWTVPCQMKTAGIEVRKVLELVYADVVVA
jgi:hypothetical protein